jgi:hypothetical protein
VEGGVQEKAASRQVRYAAWDVGAEWMLAVRRRWCWKMAYMAILRWVMGDGAVVKRILMGAVFLRRMVFEGWVMYGFSFLRGGRGWMVK